MNPEENHERLKGLKVKRSGFRRFFTLRFETEAEAELFIQSNREDLAELKRIDEEIRRLEFELMSEDERGKHLQESKALKEKYSEN